ncbi:MAG TPA: ABC transporter ATP-binding protein [Gemmataceae bacterium]|jgi:multiple sugar transport system ATP-binding protein|nr:ABC transporter ATP-binding protein [Gemmataceae bacterium]
MAEVALEHVGKVYPNGVRALHDLSFCAAEGELLALVGPSGSGKTTTLRLIAGLDDATAGSIRIGGRVVNELPPRKRDVAMVFQRHSLYPHLSVRGNLAFGLRMRQRVGWLSRLLVLLRAGRYAASRLGEQEIANRVAEAAQMLGLQEVLDRLPAQLSGGQEQRTALGRALVRRPAVFLLDEPLSNLDAPMRAEIRRELHLLHGRIRATMIYVTHDQIEAMTLGQRVVVLDRGIVQQVDSPAGLYDRPLNRFVAGFIGWPPMNFVDGRLVHDDGRLSLQGEGWALPLPGDRSAAWATLAGKPVTLGIRPEHVGLAGGATQRAKVSMEVALVEPLGHESLVTLQRGPWQVTAKVYGRQPMVNGQTVVVGFAMDQSHWFDRDSGLVLPAAGG